MWNNVQIDEEQRINAIESLLKELYNQPDETIRAAEELIAFADSIQNFESLAVAYNALSRAHYFKGNSEDSFSNLKKSIFYNKKTSDTMFTLNTQLNLVSFFQEPFLNVDERFAIINEVDSVSESHKYWSINADAKYSKALIASENRRYLTALEEIGKLDVMMNNPNLNIEHYDGRLHLSISDSYINLKKYEKAKEYSSKSIELASNKSVTLISRYYQRGKINLLLGDTLSAISDFKKGSNVQLNSLQNAIANTYKKYSKALFLYYTGSYEEAYKLFKDVLEYNKNSKRLEYLSHSYIYMSRIKYKNNELDKALELSLTGLSLTANKRFLEHELEFYQTIYNIFKLKNNSQKALEYLEKLKLIEDEVFNEENTKALAIQEAENNFAIERQATKFKYKADLRKEAEQKKIILFSSSAILLFVGLGFILFVNRKKRINAQREQVLQEEYTTQLLKKIEEERSRISGDLHDSVNHNLLQIKEKIKQGSIPDTKEISDIISQVREISHNLSPAMFNQLGLEHSVEELCRKITETTSLKLSYQIIYKKELDKNKELQIYRIIEEALSNVIKHSQATHAFIKLVSDSSALVVNIKDNGKGMKHKKEDGKTFNFGLHNIQQRSKSIKGIVSFLSSNKGTEVNLKIPA